ncbi:DUF1592 domain-containing protein [Steroidobacter cummioxidans]|uniref:DUF1592 domain-containing protein n=1 Tax=Steroidobacter cummioxidans TaxID=1803913 RepID=UPI00137B4D6E|nr:DUF1592 domain-containing protein [Steroidobacter cummioxidans]
MTGKTRLIGAGAVVVAVAATALTFFMTASDDHKINSGPSVTRRLTAEQYRNIVQDVFGGDIDLGGRFEPDMRVDGLLAVGASRVSITAAGMEQYDAMGRAVAAQVVDQNHRDMLVACKPASPTVPDEKCAGEFLSKVGRLLYRRPLTDQQLSAYMTAASEATRITGDFYQGLGLSLAAMLSSPAFLFVEQIVEPDPEHKGGFRLDSYSVASQLSFFLWNSAPDSMLLSAAAEGELQTKRGLERQVKRMKASPRLEEGVRAFFVDQLRFDEFEVLAKDAALFPKFSAQAAADAREQTMRTVLDVVLTRNADYREIFTTRKTFLTPELGSIYQVPIFKDGPNGSPDDWQPYEFAADDPRGGILTQVAFTALHSPAGRGSPTLRGKAVREIALCQTVPPPPADVSFSEFEDSTAHGASTARERLAAHATVPSCAGCHKIIDPIGFALENFDGAGEFRSVENGASIDPSGELDGISYGDAGGLGQAVYNNPAAVACVVDRLSARALGRLPIKDERTWLKTLKTDFEKSGHRLPALMQEIALSDALYRVGPPPADPAKRLPPTEEIVTTELLSGASS